jgi:CspA family cold shock protein
LDDSDAEPVTLISGRSILHPRNEEAAMLEGKVLAWSAAKGVGVVEGDDGKQAFVHHTRIASSGFKNLEEGQRIRYDLQSSERGDEAVAVIPLPLVELELSPEEGKLLQRFCGDRKIATSTRERLDAWKRPRVNLIVDLGARETLNDELQRIQAELKEKQPENPVWVVDFEFNDGAGSGWCAVGEGDREKAEALVRSRMKDFLPAGALPGEIVGALPLEDYEEETGRSLPLDCFPKPGEILPLGLEE